MSIFGHVKHLSINMIVLLDITLCLRGTCFNYCHRTWAFSKKVFQYMYNICHIKILLLIPFYEDYKCRLYSESNVDVQEELRIIKDYGKK